MSNTHPKVGEGATIYMFTDRHACTVVAVETASGKLPHRVIVQRDKCERVRPDADDVTYVANPEAECEPFSLRKNGRWIEEGSSMHNGCSLTIGERYSYRDPSF